METLKNFFNQSVGVLIEGGIILLIIVVLNIVARQIVRNIYKQSLKHDGQFLKDDFVASMLKPLRVMIWLIGLSYLIYAFIVRLQMQGDFAGNFHQFRNIVIIICSTWLCFEGKKQLQYSWAHRSIYKGKEFDKSKLNLLSKLFSASILLVSGLIILQTLGVNIGALLAIGGVGGLTIGFAAKDVFANIFGGLMIHITKPFCVGDLIHTLDEKIYGTVEYIGFYLTRVLGTDRRPFYVPNTFFTSQIFVNATRMGCRRIRQNVGIRYEDFHQIEKIILDIRKLLKESKEIAQDQLQVVNFTEFNDYSLQILVYCFSKATSFFEWSQVQQNILIEVGRIIEANGAEIAYPTSTLHLNNKNPN